MTEMLVNLEAARAALHEQLAHSDDEERVVLGYADGAEVSLMGWNARDGVQDVRCLPYHANPADSMQIVLDGGMDIYYPDTGEVVTLGRGDCHVVQRGRLHACVSGVAAVVLVVVGHLAASDLDPRAGHV